jgi:hypothetical protein
LDREVIEVKATLVTPHSAVKSEKAEPPGWTKRDELMDAVFANNRYVPGGVFVVWYLFVLLFKQAWRLIWIAGWELKRKRLRSRSTDSVAAAPRPAELNWPRWDSGEHNSQ